MGHASENWSKELIESTRKALRDGELTFHPEFGYCVKRILADGNYQSGAIPVMEALSGNFSVKLRDTEEVLPYDSIDKLLSDGWVLD